MYELSDTFKQAAKEHISTLLGTGGSNLVVTLYDLDSPLSYKEDKKSEPPVAGEVWVSGETYQLGDIVLYSGIYYEAQGSVSSTTPPPDDTVNWSTTEADGIEKTDFSVSVDSFDDTSSADTIVVTIIVTTSSHDYNYISLSIDAGPIIMQQVVPERTIAAEGTKSFTINIKF